MTTVQPGATNPIPLHTLNLSALSSSKRPPLDPPVFPLKNEISQQAIKETKTHSSAPFSERGDSGKADGAGKARLVFVGTATCVLEWQVQIRASHASFISADYSLSLNFSRRQGVRIMTDPNFVSPRPPRQHHSKRLTTSTPTPGSAPCKPAYFPAPSPSLKPSPTETHLAFSSCDRPAITFT